MPPTTSLVPAPSPAASAMLSAIPPPIFPRLTPRITFLGVPLPNQETLIPQDETTFFVDWDDTCLPSSWLTTNGYAAKYIQSPLTQEFSEMGDMIYAALEPLLLHAMELGRVTIVTNGIEGWVEKSCGIFMPKLLPLIEKLTVVSAQSRYKPAFPQNPVEWKRRTFQDILRAETRPVGATRNIVSIGDGLAEQRAVHALKGYFMGAINTVKCVKLLDNNPSPKSLVEQMTILNHTLDGLVHHPSHVDLLARIVLLPPLPNSPSESGEEI